MLSQQCQSRVAPQIRRLTAQRRTAVEEIAQLCSRVSESDDSFDPDEFDLDSMEQNLASYLDSIGLQVSLKKLMDVSVFLIFVCVIKIKLHVDIFRDSDVVSAQTQATHLQWRVAILAL